MTSPPLLEKTLIDILRIHSVTGQEKEICDFVETDIKTRNSDLPVLRIGNSLVVGAAGKKDKPLLALVGHLDTVPGKETGDLVRKEGDKIIGLGSSDMKAGVAVMLELLRKGTIMNSPYDLTYIFYESEEGPFAKNGLHEILKRVPSLTQTDFAFFLEPTDNVLHLGCLGVCSAKVRFHGKRAHSARPWFGENAIHKAAGFLDRLSRLEPKTVMYGPLEFKEVVSATLASGGIAVNIVPDMFEVTVNIRIAPGTSIPEAQENFLKLVQDEASVEFFNPHPSGPVPVGNEIFTRFQKHFALPEKPKQAYTDVGLFATHGIASANFGPGITEQAHQAGEYVMLDDVVKNFEMFKEFLNGK